MRVVGGAMPGEGKKDVLEESAFGALRSVGFSRQILRDSNATSPSLESILLRPLLLPVPVYDLPCIFFLRNLLLYNFL